MMEARDHEAFLESAEGGFVAGSNWLYFAVDRSLLGYAIWGRPEPDDIRALVRVLEDELARPPHHALVDLGGLEVIVPEAFELLAAYTVQHEVRLAEIVTHAAIVRPRGLNGAVVSGFFEMASQPFPFSFWADTRAALEHLGRIDAASVATSLVHAQASVAGEPALMRELRLRIASAPATAALDAVARTLGVAPRTLQRRLAENGTTFDAQVQSVRLEAARRMLEDGTTPVTRIALELGFATPQHFSTLFRKETGETPTSFRARRRRTE